MMRILLTSLFVACGTTGTAPSFTATMTIDAAPGSETFECFGFDASTVAGEYITHIHWEAPTGQSVQLHHAALYAYPKDFPDGPIACNEMPLAWQVHVWFQGGNDVIFPDDVALRLRADTKRLVVHAHVLRTAAGPPASAKLVLSLRRDPPRHVAAILPAAGAVPAIRPHMMESTTTRCRTRSAFHVMSTAPHMHKLGSSFVGAIENKATIADVRSWSFDRQATYPVDRDVNAGDVIVTSCTWFNPTDEYVLPGFRTADEMCGQLLMVYPADAAWDGECF